MQHSTNESIDADLGWDGWFDTDSDRKNDVVIAGEDVRSIEVEDRRSAQAVSPVGQETPVPPRPQ